MPIGPSGQARPRALAATCPSLDRTTALRIFVLVLMGLSIAALAGNRTWASGQIASVARTVQNRAAATSPLTELKAAIAAPPAPAPGIDADGDGQSDFMNPTGRAERSHDAYGSGQFGASRDGGERRHEGVDYVSRAGQGVFAPMSGFVTRVGWAYAGDATLRTVEITNPALNYVARVLYVSPKVEVGQAVAMGDVIGHAQDLQSKYPGGMTNHVHLQIAPQGKSWMDATLLIPSTRG